METQNSNQILKVDYSKSNTYYQCPRKYFFSYIQGITSEHGSSAIRFGSAFHAGMEGFYSYVKEHGWDRTGKAVEQMIQFAYKNWQEETEGKKFYEDYRNLENLSILMQEYLSNFYQDEGFLKVIHTERAFKLLMRPTQEDIKRFSWLEPFYFTGKIDQEIELSGSPWINEFKTTGWSADSLSKELTRSPQIIGYNYASKNLYKITPEGNLVTIIYCKSVKSKTTGNYGKLSTSFLRIPQVYNTHDLLDWREHFISLVSQIQLSHKTNYFPPRFQSCFSFNRCEFLNICEQSRPLDQASYNGYCKKEIWDVTTEVSSENLMEGEE